MSSLYKKGIFSKVLSTRAGLQLTDPNALPTYDKGVLALGVRFLDEQDGFRFTFGDRADFRMFVDHLIGYSFGGTILPPVDREKGLALARSLVASDRFLFIEKQ